MMVAYSFQKRFAPPIVQGTKTHTIRGHRKRHARLGERIQLYQGMRTRFCRKIIDDPKCTKLMPIQIYYDTGAVSRIVMDNIDLPEDGLDSFAASDGFTDLNDMHRFWMKNHELDGACFDGVCISWDSRWETSR